MAAEGGLITLIGGLEDRTKKALTELIRAGFGLLRFGPLETAKAENFLGYKLTSTTASSTGEFSVLHNMGTRPYLLMPVVDLSVIGAGVVPLEVTRAADTRRIYLKTSAGFTNKTFSIYLE